ncbi:type II toxin-antitoxin system HipA family toxin [Acidimangrovimonas sediminis]|uniref:type II toxin-antitoxin system HipA family toxin n=1 Tax=Acidimangrovimonas sediminis TaxID=2056283 RepID=UPI000C801B01|nr:type II toxin-antitoxin system HipA family toxin [Acidimangrovimonas sediminis]
MGRKRSYAPLDVYMNRRKVGQFTRTPDGAFSFSYAPEWLDWENTLPVSRALPLGPGRHAGPRVIAVFENLLPDNDDIRRRVAERVGADGLDAYSLLSRIGRDCAGALQFLPEGEVPAAGDALTGEPLDDTAIAALLNDLGAAPLGIRRERDFRISVAGAQEKTALLLHEGRWLAPTGTTPTTHILKPAIGTLPNGMDLTDSIENEHFCLRLMAGFGLATADTRIADFAGTRALVVERFDRLRARDGRLIRLPQEDCCQALSVPPTRKYQNEGGPGIAEICDLLRGSDTPLRDRAAFFKANVLFWLIGATDGHAKNFSIALMPGGRFTLTPLYDVLSVQPTLEAGQLQSKEMRLAMRVGRNRHYRVDEIHGRHFAETGAEAGFSPGQIAEIFDEIAAAAEAAFATALAEMPAGRGEAVASSIRRGFDRRLARLEVGVPPAAAPRAPGRRPRR